MRIGAYEKISDLGAGGMGIVILARHLTTGQLYAIKLIKEKLIYHQEGLRRFEREKRILRELSQHPYMLPLVDSGTHDGVPYYVMPYVDGISLKERIQAGRLAPMECEAIIRNIADALNYAHKNQILHRDIKPGNILIDREGNAYLTDFGIAADAVATQEQITRDLSQMGSIGYTAPEINLGKTATVRSEVYSLGAVAYEMLTGIQLLDAMTRMDNFWQPVPPPIASVLQRATHRTISERFDNVRDFYYAFSGAVRDLYGETTIAQQVPTLETNDFESPSPVAPSDSSTSSTATHTKSSNSGLIITVMIVLILLLTVPVYFILTEDISEDDLFGTPNTSQPITTVDAAADDEPVATVTRNINATATRIPSRTPNPTATSLPSATFTPSSTPTNTVTPSPVPTEVVSIVIVNAQGTNLRSGPGTEFPMISVATNGRVYNVIARTSNPTEPWFLINHDGQRLWILSTVVQIIGDRNDVPIAVTVPASP